MPNEEFERIDKAVNGDKNALGNLLFSVQDMVYNLSLRMLGSPHDAEDAVQEIMIKIMTQLGAFPRGRHTTLPHRVAPSKPSRHTAF